MHEENPPKSQLIEENKQQREQLKKTAVARDWRINYGISMRRERDELKNNLINHISCETK